jgi:hypothetical protein
LLFVIIVLGFGRGESKVMSNVASLDREPPEQPDGVKPVVVVLTTGRLWSGGKVMEATLPKQLPLDGLNVIVHAFAA